MPIPSAVESRIFDFFLIILFVILFNITVRIEHFESISFSTWCNAMQFNKTENSMKNDSKRALDLNYTNTFEKYLKYDFE